MFISGRSARNFYETKKLMVVELKKNFKYTLCMFRLYLKKMQ